MGDTAHPGGTWGAYVEALSQRRGWNTTKLAKESGIARATLYKWRTGKGGVTVDLVVRLAQTAGDDPEIALRAAGGRLVNEAEDPQLADIYASDLSEAEKQELVEYVLEERRRNEDALQRNVRMMIRTRGGKAAG